MSIERFFLFNLLMDLCVVAAVLRGFGAFRLHRAMLSSALCAVYGTAAAMAPALRSPPVQLILLAATAVLAVGRRSAVRAVTCAASMLVAALIAGVCAERTGAPRGLCALLIPGFLSAAVRRRVLDWAAVPAEIEVVNLGGVARFSACMDTGNRLTEPLSGQPVLVVSAGALGDVLPASGYRCVAYGSVGGSGTLPCFKPEGIYISGNRGRRRATEAWIAVFPDRLPGAFPALIPAELVLY